MINLVPAMTSWALSEKLVSCWIAACAGARGGLSSGLGLWASSFAELSGILPWQSMALGGWRQKHQVTTLVAAIASLH